MPSVPSLTRRNEDGDVDYQCPKGHRVHGETVEWRVNGMGRSYPNCRTCRQDYRRDYKKRPEVRARKRAKAEAKRPQGIPTIYSLNGSEIPIGEYMGAEKKSVPWNLLRPKPEASRAFDEFDEALKYTDVPCRGRAAEFTEYADPRPAYALGDDEGRLPMPSAVEAVQLCAQCPLWDLCDRYATLERPDFGIHAGKRYIGGKIVP